MQENEIEKIKLDRAKLEEEIDQWKQDKNAWLIEKDRLQEIELQKIQDERDQLLREREVWHQEKERMEQLQSQKYESQQEQLAAQREQLLLEENEQYKKFEYEKA